MDTIIKGTTPTIQYIFPDVDVEDITVAFLTIRQAGIDVITRDIHSAEVDIEESMISWTLTQEETLQLMPKGQATAYLDWKLADGTRSGGETVTFSIAPTGKNEVI